MSCPGHSRWFDYAKRSDSSTNLKALSAGVAVLPVDQLAVIIVEAKDHPTRVCLDLSYQNLNDGSKDRHPCPGE